MNPRTRLAGGSEKAPQTRPREDATDFANLLRKRLVGQTPDASTIGFYDRRSRTTNEEPQTEFLRRSATLADRFFVSGVEPGDYVIIASTSPRTTLMAFVAATFASAVPVVLPIRPAFDDAASTEERVSSAIALLGTGAHLAVEMKNGCGVIPVVPGRPIIYVNPEEIEAKNWGTTLKPIRVGAFSHVQLTSGTTGEGKGVAVTHSSLLANINAINERAAINPYDVFVSWLPLYHDMGLVGQALTALGLGIDLHLMSPFDFIADPISWLRVISEKHGTHTASPTFGYELVTKKAKPRDVVSLDLTHLRTASCGAEPVSAAVARSFYERFAAAGLRAEAFTPSFGLAEATLAVTLTEVSQKWRSLDVTLGSLRRLERIELAPSESAANSNDAVEVVSVGKAVNGLTIELRADDGTLIEDELTCGEIVVAGTSVTHGFVTKGGHIEPFDGTGLSTGDIGFVQGGELFVVDRIKNLVIRNGENYSSYAIERVLASAAGVPVDNVYVCDRDITNASGLTGLIELSGGADAPAIFSKLDLALRSFEPALDSLVFLKRGSLPRTTSGKKRHAAARALLNEGSLEFLASIFHEVP